MNKESQGVYKALKKDGTIYYRSSITFLSKHISLGSFESEQLANKAYLEADMILHNKNIKISNFYDTLTVLAFTKWVILINYRDNRIYFKTPIYLKSRYFLYCLSPFEEFKFDIDDLFYFSDKNIMRRNGHLFVNDFGIQTNILTRYGIKNHAVQNKDYYFKNNDNTDFRYQNIIVINPYLGVEFFNKKGRNCYIAKIHVNGYYTIGYYNSEETAAIAYNKAVDLALKYGVNKNYQTNYIISMNSDKYINAYQNVTISKKYINYLKKLQNM